MKPNYYKRLRRWWKKSKPGDRVFYITESTLTIYNIVSAIICFHPSLIICLMWIFVIVFLYVAFSISNRREKYMYYMKGKQQAIRHYIDLI